MDGEKAADSILSQSYDDAWSKLILLPVLSGLASRILSIPALPAHPVHPQLYLDSERISPSALSPSRSPRSPTSRLYHICTSYYSCLTPSHLPHPVDIALSTRPHLSFLQGPNRSPAGRPFRKRAESFPSHFVCLPRAGVPEKESEEKSQDFFPSVDSHGHRYHG